MLRPIHVFRPFSPFNLPSAGAGFGGGSVSIARAEPDAGFASQVTPSRLSAPRLSVSLGQATSIFESAFARMPPGTYPDPVRHFPARFPPFLPF